MRPLYLSSPVRQSLGTCLRPGGVALTRRALELLALFQPQSRGVTLDAGCGAGGSLQVLSNEGRCVYGLDLDYGLLSEAQKSGVPLIQADLAHLPLAAGSVETVFCECSWNLTCKSQTLAEFHRVLPPGGFLVLSDIYLRAGKEQQTDTAWPVTSCFSYATDLESVEKKILTIGFEVVALEDHIHLFKQTAAEFVFAHGSLQKFWQAVTGDEDMAGRACNASLVTRPSLFLLIAKRSTEENE